MAELVRFAAEATRVVDQFVVDGKLDLVVVNNRTERPWIHVSALGSVALDVKWGKTRLDIRQDFERALGRDFRYLGSDSERHYQFEPVLSPDSSVEPRLKAYVCGTAHATPEQYAAAAVRVQQLFDVLCKGDGVLTQLSIRRLLADSRITSRSEIAAMREYVSRGADGQVLRLPDGRFVIKHVFKGDIETVEPEPQIKDLTQAIIEALRVVEVSRNMVTNRASILSALTKMQGHLIAENQIAEFNRIIDSLPDILKPIDYGRYVLNKSFFGRS